MRVRKRQGAEELLAGHPELVATDGKALRGHWQSVFEKSQPIFVELGSGKGDFICGMAARFPDINFVAIDLQVSVLSYALDKVLAAGLTNVKLLLADGSQLTEFFAQAEVSRLYLNFSDPWPKRRHEKRRLTYKTFLAMYEQILPSAGEVHFKTDNRGLFEYSLVSMSQYGMILQRVQLDLHQEIAFADENIETEYERKFSAKGPIYRLEARFNA